MARAHFRATPADDGVARFQSPGLPVWSCPNLLTHLINQPQDRSVLRSSYLTGAGRHQSRLNDYSAWMSQIAPAGGSRSTAE